MSALSFSISDTEQKTLEAWLAQHKPICRAVLKAAARGGLTFSFHPTTMGTVTHVSCVCGDRVNITDFETW